MSETQSKSPLSTWQKWGVSLGLIGLAVFMYVTIIYKIVNFGA